MTQSWYNPHELLWQQVRRYEFLSFHPRCSITRKHCHQNGYKNHRDVCILYLRVLTTALLTVPFLISPFGMAFFTATTILSPTRAYLFLNHQEHGYKAFSTAVVGYGQSTLLLYHDYLALSMISTNLHLFILLKGRVSIILTVSPMLHSFFSS